MGATENEIGRFPVRVLGATDEPDELLAVESQSSTLSSSCDDKFCAICLEEFCRGEEVRTIPCSHTFHSKCIDPWLKQKAICPVCKQSVIG